MSEQGRFESLEAWGCRISLQVGCAGERGGEQRLGTHKCVQR